MEVIFFPDDALESCKDLLAARKCESPDLTAAEIVQALQESALLIEVDLEQPTIN